MSAISYKDFTSAAEEFVKISEKINNGWRLLQKQEDRTSTCLKKESFITCEGRAGSTLLKTDISEKDFYSVITQQEHPLFFRPYFIMHPCHTEDLLSLFKDKSKNIIVTFLGLITPLIKLDLPLEYGL